MSKNNWAIITKYLDLNYLIDGLIYPLSVGRHNFSWQVALCCVSTTGIFCLGVSKGMKSPPKIFTSKLTLLLGKCLISWVQSSHYPRLSWELTETINTSCLCTTATGLSIGFKDYIEWTSFASYQWLIFLLALVQLDYNICIF